MDRRINWLHLTDLHYGQKGQNILFPKIKHELFKDIEYIKGEIGKIDIVFFTGDLSQSGKQEEFDELTVFLKEMWGHFNKLNSNPYLIAIPGNHDLARPDTTKAAVKVLRNYHNDDEFQESFWTGLVEKSEYYGVIDQCFGNFCNWYKEIKLPKPNLKYGIVPGDISAEININQVSINVIGLNTAFLELNSDDYLGKLAIHPSQLLALTEQNPLDWIANADVSLLLTHHDPKWLGQNSLTYYNNDINPSNTFYSHLCGHLHEANTFQHGLVGSGLRKTQLAPSLFGLQKINNQLDRIHGYYAGSYIIEGSNLKEFFYPRKANKRYDGSFSIDADNGYNLGKKGYLEFNHTINTNEIADDSNQGDSNRKESSETTTSLVEENILDLKASPDNKKELDKIPKISFTFLPQHSKIRLIEQNNFLKLLEEDHIVWLITDWGLDESGFIGSISDRINLDNAKNSFFLNCEDIASEKEFVAAFDQQFGMPLQRFCNIASTLDNTLFVIDHVNSSLYATGTAFSRFTEILKSILDYCTQLTIVILARQVPNSLSEGQYIRLSQLDAAQTKLYVEHHPGNTLELDSPANLLKLIEITSGLPKHIDRIIDNLRVATFEELVDAEKEIPIEAIQTNEIPKALRQAISSLADTTDRLKLRSLKLLKILTVLSNGETFSNLNRFDSTEPIYLDNANELESLSLLEVITTTKVLSKVAGNPTLQIKILRIPRQIRDYINTLITEN